jgi:hypothetical protein
MTMKELKYCKEENQQTKRMESVQLVAKSNKLRVLEIT